MKRIVVAFMAAAMVITLASCGIANVVDSVDSNESSRIEINQKLCSDDAVDISLAYIEDGTVFFSVTDKTDKDMNISTEFFDLNGTTYTDEYTCVGIYAGKTQFIRLEMLDDNLEAYDINVSVGDTIGGQFYYWVEDSFEYEGRLRFDDIVVTASTDD